MVRLWVSTSQSGETREVLKVASIEWNRKVFQHWRWCLYIHCGCATSVLRNLLWQCSCWKSFCSHVCEKLRQARKYMLSQFLCHRCGAMKHDMKKTCTSACPVRGSWHTGIDNPKERSSICLTGAVLCGSRNGVMWSSYSTTSLWQSHMGH